MDVNIKEAFALGYGAGVVQLGVIFLVGLILFYAALFFYQTAKIKLLMKFLRKRKLVQVYADFKASDEAGKFWKREELE